MNSFDTNLWASATEALLYLWMGSGFAYKSCDAARVMAAHDRPFHVGSPAMVSQLAQICQQNGPRASRFVNNLLNHLNWTVAELSQMVGELREPAPAAGTDRERDARYGRCVLLHEISVRLMRLLEGLARDLPALFAARSAEAETNLIRVLEVTLHVLDRTLSPGQFAAVLDHDFVMQPANRMLLLCPALGVLMALVAAETGRSDGGPRPAEGRVMVKVGRCGPGGGGV